MTYDEAKVEISLTCLEKDQDRRIVAARRVRTGEDANKLKKLVENSWKK